MPVGELDMIECKGWSLYTLPIHYNDSHTIHCHSPHNIRSLGGKSGALLQCIEPE